jgi:hypothetical protein
VLIVTLEETKAFLRLDSNHEDALITSFIISAEDIVEGVLRFPLSDFLVGDGTLPELVKTTVWYVVSQFHELRENVDVRRLIETSALLLTAYRRNEW